MESKHFIQEFIEEDLAGRLNELATRFPPEPNGYLHIGHAKSIVLNYGLAQKYGGTFNLRFDDTNPAKESQEYVDSIKEDVSWLGADYTGREYYASDYFETFFDCAVNLINKGLAFVCELTGEEMNQYRGTFTEPGKDSPYRERSIEENMRLFTEMREGKHPDGSMTLRAKIDMKHPNMSMRDPVIYRIAHIHHHNTGDEWCIYPMYDFAHPLEDAIENITHSLCSLEFENNRLLYNWFIEHAWTGTSNPRQIEFAKLKITGTILGKRYIMKLVEEGKVEGWDDPRLMTLKGLRRRGYTPEIIRNFCEDAGVSKADSTVDAAQLEFHARDVLKKAATSIMAVLDPLKVVITNYPEGQTEMLTTENSQETDMGNREMPFSREIYIEREDFLEEAPKKFFRLTVGKEVRLKAAYFIMCHEVIKDEAGNIIQLNCTYDPLTKSGMPVERKVKGTIHWVNADTAVKATVRQFGQLADENGEFNPDSVTVLQGLIEPAIQEKKHLPMQFLRTGYYTEDRVLSAPEALVFNEIVGLKSSFKG